MMTDVDVHDSDAIVALGDLALRFSRINRITYHQDGMIPESDTDHTVMLGLICCAFAQKHLPALDLGLIAQFCLTMNPPLWKPKPEHVRELQQWVRRLESVQRMLRQEC